MSDWLGSHLELIMPHGAKNGPEDLLESTNQIVIVVAEFMKTNNIKTN